VRTRNRGVVEREVVAEKAADGQPFALDHDGVESDVFANNDKFAHIQFNSKTIRRRQDEQDFSGCSEWSAFSHSEHPEKSCSSCPLSFYFAHALISPKSKAPE
jgi:hypothetical protein